ncbi:MAG: archaemetzincin [Parachlamydia sp.]|nr:archaemetzincin [Parachlamydia sp.]
MPEITFQQVLKLADIQHPEKHSLNAACQLTGRRSRLKNFLGWAIYLMTFTIVSKNSSLDGLTRKIAVLAHRTLLDETFSLERKNLTLKALRNLITIIATNSGSRQQEIHRLIMQAENLSVRPAIILSLEEELAKAKREEVARRSPHEDEWRAGPGLHERKQTLQDYKAFCSDAVKQRRTLRIHQLGQFTPAEVKALRIATDYLSAVHGLTVELDPQAHSIDDLARRHRELRNLQGRRVNLPDSFCQPRIQNGRAPQYHASHLNDIAETQLHRGDRHSSSICFTKEDLYETDMNFVFGAARYGSVGVFSIHRLGNANTDANKFKQCLQRLMKIASHEFAHMRCIAHCTDRVCNIQGCNNIPEMDRTPFHFCAEDMAKIAHCNGTSLKESYKRHLEFLENFSSKYGVKIDFSQDIAYLKARIRALRS